LDFIEEDVPYSRQRDFLHYTGDSTRLRNGISYINKNRTITRIENDKETIVFTVPVWQRWFRAFKLILIFSCIGLFLRIGIPLWVKEFRKMNKNIQRIKKEQAKKHEKLP
jgi:type II secretory pathway component PulF